MQKLCKLLTTMAFMLYCGIMQAQILNYDFEQLNVGDKVAATLGDPWTTWNNAPGSSEDAVVSDEYAEDTRSVKIEMGNDFVLKLGDKTAGAYRLSLDMFIPDNKMGYFNILHEYTGTGTDNTWAFQVWLNSYKYDNLSYLYDGSEQYFFDNVPYNEWIHVDVEIYLDDTLACMKINNDLIYSWDYSRYLTSNYGYSDAYGISAMNFCNDIEEHAGYFIDNIKFEEIEGPFVHNVTTPNNEINAVVAKDNIDTSYYFTLRNEGNAIGYVAPWIDYGVGEDGGDPVVFHYDSDPYSYCGNYDNAPYIELGIRCQDSLIGKKISQMNYWMPYDYETGGLGCTGPVAFRIYQQIGSSYVVIAEKEVYDYSPNTYINVSFDELIPIRTHGYIAAVGFQQKEGGYPMSLDAGPAIQHYGDLVRLNGHGEWFSLTENSIVNNGGNDYGNHNIRLTCVGHPVKAGWLGIYDDAEGYIYPGNANNYRLWFNADGLEYSVYQAVIHVKTNNDVNPELTVPITLKVTGTGVNETFADKYNIYPNPACDVINIDGADLNCAVIYNSLGQIVNIKKITNNAIRISELSDGVYYLNIINNKGENSIQKIVVTR